MTLWSSRQVREENMVACPECGRMFVRRGLAAHRRMRHGPGSPPETDPSAKTSPVDAVAIARALDDLAQAVGRLDARIDRLLAAPQPAPALPSPTVQAGPPPSAKQTLESELDALLTEIARVRDEGEAARSQSADGGTTIEPAVRQHLGKLRRRQVSILARLLDLEGDPVADELEFL
jgi:hypothetical protein